MCVLGSNAGSNAQRRPAVHPCRRSGVAASLDEQDKRGGAGGAGGVGHLVEVPETHARHVPVRQQRRQPRPPALSLRPAAFIAPFRADPAAAQRTRRGRSVPIQDTSYFAAAAAQNTRTPPPHCAAAASFRRVGVAPFPGRINGPPGHRRTCSARVPAGRQAPDCRASIRMEAGCQACEAAGMWVCGLPGLMARGCAVAWMD